MTEGAGFDYTDVDVARLEARYGGDQARVHRRRTEVLQLLYHAMPAPMSQRDAEMLLDAADDSYRKAVALFDSGPIDHVIPTVSLTCPNSTTSGCRCGEHHLGLLEYASDPAGYGAYLNTRERDPAPRTVTVALLRWFCEHDMADDAYRLWIGTCTACRLSRASSTHMEICRDPRRPTFAQFRGWLNAQEDDRPLRRRRPRSTGPRRVRRLPQGQSRVSPDLTTYFVDPDELPRKAA